MEKYSTQSYYIGNDNCNIERSDISLSVNCCGIAKVAPSDEMNLKARRDHYLIYMICGELNTEIDQKRISLQEGDAICIPPNTAYRYACASTESAKYFWIHFTGSEAYDTMRFSDFKYLTPYKVGEVVANAKLYEALFCEFRTRHPFMPYRASLILRNILLQLCAKQNDTAVAKKPLDQSLRYIHMHLSSNITVKKLAEIEYLSEGYYRTLFKSTMGTSPNKYIATQRIIRAKELLLDTSIQIDKIAQIVGIDDRLYFQRFFKKHTGISPAEYRKRV